jgi:tetratricopeptide (TPR) repeat protein
MFYRDLSQRKVSEHPNDPQAWFDLGVELMGLGQREEALHAMRNAHLLSGAEMVLIYIALLEIERRQFTEALAALDGIGDTSDLGLMKHLYRGDVLYEKERMEEALAAYQQGLQIADELTGVDGRRLQLLSRIGYIEVRLGRLAIGLANMRHAVEASPSLQEMHDRLMKGCLLIEDIGAAAEVADRATAYLPHEKNFLQAAALRMKIGDHTRAQELVRLGLRKFPASVVLQAMAG